MHLLATNLAMWIHIVIKESVLEISHVDDDHENSTQLNTCIEEVTFTIHFHFVSVANLPIILVYSSYVH